MFGCVVSQAYLNLHQDHDEYPPALGVGFVDVFGFVGEPCCQTSWKQ